jgi:hypothetical protein
MCLPTAKFQRLAHILHSAFLTQPPQLPSPQEGLLLGADMDGTTDMDTFGAGSGTSEFPNSSNPATPATNKHVRPAASDDDNQSKSSSGSKHARVDNVSSSSSDGSAPLKEKKILQFAVGYVNGGKPKAADYKDVVQALLLCAMHEYESCIVSVSLPRFS